MKKLSLLVLVLLVVVSTSCKREEEIRVESVIGVYNSYSDCSLTNLVTQDPPALTMDTTTLYVTIPADDENGFVSLMGQEVYLEQDLSFRKSIANYSLIGEFDGNGGLTFAIDHIDTEAQTRSQCAYVCTLK
jgi:hypothetical protein